MQLTADFHPGQIRNFELDGEVPDNEWESLLKEENISSSRKKAEEKLRDTSSDEIAYLRRRIKNDLFVLSTGVLGFDRLSYGLHRHLCRWMERNREWQFKEILLPRGHFKSTIATIADSIQIVLPDDDGSQPWPRNLGTDCRLLICHETDGQASNFLFSITGHLLGNPLLMGLYPEIIPSPRKHRINRHELELPREGKWPEPTIDTMGVGGRSQGRHYNYIKFDDLIGDKARDSEAVMEASKEWFDNVQSFFSKFITDHFDLIGTRWAFDDLYSHIDDRYEDLLLRYCRGVEELDPVLGIKVPIFPEEFPLERLAVLRKNKRVFSAQYENNPDASATEFDKSWKRFYHRINHHQLVVFSGRSQTRINVRDLDICILYDPAMTGLAGLVVTGTDRLNRVFVLESLKDEWKPPQACDLIFKLVAKYQPRLVAIEEVLFSGVYKHWFEAEMKNRGVYFNIFPVSPVVGGRVLSKPMRVRGLENYFSAGHIYFDVSHADIIQEYDRFGVTKNYHLLDALAYGPDVWLYQLSRAKFESYKRTEEQLLGARDLETGYSQIDLVAP